MTEAIADNYRTPPKLKFTKENNKLYVEGDGEKINLTEMLNKVNFNHLSFSSNEIHEYARITRLHNQSPTYEEFKDRIDNADIKQKVTLGKLEYGEILSVYKYTSNEYTKMNGFLRGQHDKLQPDEIADIMVSTAIASYSLNNVPDIELPPYVIRNQDDYGLDQLIKNAEAHKISQIKAFISTGLSSQEGFNGGVKVVYKGVSGKSISAISCFPNEQEYLIPPSTQLKWTGHRIASNGEHIFTAEGANALLNKKHILPSYQARQEIESLAQDLKSNFKDIKKYQRKQFKIL